MGEGEGGEEGLRLLLLPPFFSLRKKKEREREKKTKKQRKKSRNKYRNKERRKINFIRLLKLFKGKVLFISFLLDIKRFHTT